MAVGVKHVHFTINRNAIFYLVENQNQRVNSLDLKRAKLRVLVEANSTEVYNLFLF